MSRMLLLQLNCVQVHNCMMWRWEKKSFSIHYDSCWEKMKLGWSSWQKKMNGHKDSVCSPAMRTGVSSLYLISKYKQIPLIQTGCICVFRCVRTDRKHITLWFQNCNIFSKTFESWVILRMRMISKYEVILDWIQPANKF